MWISSYPLWLGAQLISEGAADYEASLLLKRWGRAQQHFTPQWPHKRHGARNPSSPLLLLYTDSRITFSENITAMKLLM